MIKCIIIVFIIANCESLSDQYREKLLVKPLPTGNVYTAFQFITEKDIDLDSSCKYDIEKKINKSVTRMYYIVQKIIVHGSP